VRRRASGRPARAGPGGPEPSGPGPELTHRLLDWFFRNRRELPWREEHDPYRVWLAEVMLQQTRGRTVAPYYLRFLERFPDLSALAAAGEQEVLKAWEGLGYYARARSLLAAARKIVREYGGRFPSDPEAVRSLPGVGPYTAAAVLSIAFARPLGVVDGNVIRVVARLTVDGGDPAGRALRERARRFVEDSFGRYHPGWVNQAWMELGALVCRPVPDCPQCPLGFACRALNGGRTRELPARRPRPALPARVGTLFVLLPGGGPPAAHRPHALPAAGRAQPALPAAAARVEWQAAWDETSTAGAARRGELLRASGLPLLLVRRPSPGLLGGLWEFPSAGKAGTLCADCGVELISTPGTVIRQVYSHFEERLSPVLGQMPRESRLGGRLAFWPEQRWLLPAEIGGLPRTRVTVKALRWLGLADSPPGR
jgi:A/G-specific adenine glycosylase